MSKQLIKIFLLCFINVIYIYNRLRDKIRMMPEVRYVERNQVYVLFNSVFSVHLYMQLLEVKLIIDIIILSLQ